jgi:hypothetical protein
MKKYFFDIDNKGTTNHQLIKIAKMNNIKLKINDVMMMDMIFDIKLGRYHNLILNLADLGENGTHWVCMVIRGKKCLIIDSFGCTPDKKIIKFCLDNKLNLAFSKYICQELKSVRCGIYCLQAIKYLHDSTATNLFNDANDYVNLYEPLYENTNERIVMDDLII